MTEDEPQAETVAIIGSGPVGMVLALFLARQGVRTVLIERDETTLWHPKGNTHNARTMEHYRKLGLADELRALGLPVDHPTDVAYLTGLRGRELYRHRMPSTRAKLTERDARAPLDQIPEPLQRVNQMYVERAVHGHVLDEPAIDTFYGWELEHFEETRSEVVLHIHRVADDARKTLRVGYLVGCDGPRSIVRETLGFRYVGADSFSQSFMGGPMLSTYVRIRARGRPPVDAAPGWQYWVLRHGTILNFVSLDGRDDYIFTASQLDARDAESVRSAVIGAIGGDAADIDVEVVSAREWVAGRALVAERYRKGRVFLCGDSTHLFTPTGGFGMNTGVDDAVNLAWKLAGAVRGWGGNGLLDSYETERRPIGVRNSGAARVHAGNIQDIDPSALLEADTPEGEAARAACVGILRALKEEFASIGIQLGARYDGSPLIAQADEAPPPDDPFRYTPSSVPGGRVPHLWLPDGTSLLDHIAFRFTLLRFDPAIDTNAIEQAAARRGVPFAVLDIDMPEARSLYPKGLALVRPDDHIAWRGDSVEDADALLDRVLGFTGAA